MYRKDVYRVAEGLAPQADMSVELVYDWLMQVLRTGAYKLPEIKAAITATPGRVILDDSNQMTKFAPSGSSRARGI